MIFRFCEVNTSSSGNIYLSNRIFNIEIDWHHKGYHETTREWCYFCWYNVTSSQKNFPDQTNPFPTFWITMRVKMKLGSEIRHRQNGGVSFSFSRYSSCHINLTLIFFFGYVHIFFCLKYHNYMNFGEIFWHRSRKSVLQFEYKWYSYCQIRIQQPRSSNIQLVWFLKPLDVDQHN